MSQGNLVRVGIFLSALSCFPACGSDSTDESGTGAMGGASGQGGAGGAASGSGGDGAMGGTSGSGGASGTGAAGGAAGTAGQAEAGQSGDAGSGGSSVTSGVAVTPAQARASFEGRVQFSAIVSGVDDMSVTWSIEEGERGGSVDAQGLYTAPSTSGVFHVIATSSADSTLSGSASVTVSAPAGTPPVLEPGVWTDISPPDSGMVCCPESGGNSYGVLLVEVDPSDPNTIYTGIDVLGIWKTTDRGSTWRRLGSPDEPSTYIDTPIRLRVNPNDSNHLYATQGVHGANLGFWVSRDGGDTWAMPQGFVEFATASATRDVTMMSVDAADFDHVILSSHSPWPGLNNAGVMETKDGGETWVAHAPRAEWGAGTMGVSILNDPASGVGDPDTWLVGTDGQGMWRTTDAGESWTKVSDSSVPHGGGEIYYSPTGVLYAGATPYPIKSTDNGATWEAFGGESGLAFSYYYTVYGDGTTLYTAPAYTGTNAGVPQPFFTASEADGGPFTEYAGGVQEFIDGPYIMRFDSANRIMYGANWGAGLLAMKLP